MISTLMPISNARVNDGCGRSEDVRVRDAANIAVACVALDNPEAAPIHADVIAPLVKTHHAPSSLQWRRRTALSTTQIDERIIATQASMGLSTQPVNG